MNREEAIKILKQRECCRECVVDCTCNECDKAFEMAIEALKQEPKESKDIHLPLYKVGDRIEPGTDGNAYKLSMSNGKEFEQQPCEDCISRANALRVAKNEYLRGWHNSLCKALSEKYSIHCEEGNLTVIQEETITGLGLSMDCAVGKDVESYMSTIPSVIPKGVTVTDFADKCRECGKMNKWIPVSERLPELGHDVLGIDPYNDVLQACTYNDCGEIKWVSDRGSNTLIVAWRPLPEPYQEESE